MAAIAGGRLCITGFSPKKPTWNTRPGTEHAGPHIGFLTQLEKHLIDNPEMPIFTGRSKERGSNGSPQTALAGQQGPQCQRQGCDISPGRAVPQKLEHVQA